MEFVLKRLYLEKIPQIFPLFSLLFSFLASDALGIVSPLNLGYGVLFYWTVYRPNLLPLKGLFVIGLIVDGLMGRDLGISFLQMLFVFTLTLSQRVSFFQAAFSVVWVGFSFFMALFSLLLFGLHFFWAGSIPYETMIESYLWVVAVYPILSVFLIRLHHFLP